jgi:hypothetical protein
MDRSHAVYIRQRLTTRIFDVVDGVRRDVGDFSLADRQRFSPADLQLSLAGNKDK